MTTHARTNGAALISQNSADVEGICRTGAEFVVFLSNGGVNRIPSSSVDGVPVERLVFEDSVTVDVSNLEPGKNCKIEDLQVLSSDGDQTAGLLMGLLGLGAVGLALSAGGARASGPEISINAVAKDDIVNGSESLRAVVIDGSAPADRPVTIAISGVQDRFITQSDQGGFWSVTIPANTFPPGTSQRTITAAVTDQSGRFAQSVRSILVDTETAVTFTAPSEPSPLADGFVNLTESRGQIRLSGQAEPGSTAVMVAWTGDAQPAVLSPNGSWEIVFPARTAGELTRESLFTVTSTDRAGNIASAVMPVKIDLETTVTLMSQPVGADNVLSGGERTAGLTLTGTAEPGAQVHVSFNGINKAPVVADANGNWTVTFASAELPSGEISSGAAGRTISVYSVDPAGNVSPTITHTLDVDTVVRNFSFPAPDLIGATNTGGTDATTLNAVERQAGLPVQGTVEPGSSVTLTVGTWSQTIPASQTTSGTWTTTIPASALPEGNNASVTISVTARDQYGNVSQTLQNTIPIDTVVTDFPVSAISLGAASDGWLNAREAHQGMTISGISEVGSNVAVEIGGVAKATTTDATGTWSVTFGKADLPVGELTGVTASITATDMAGNTFGPQVRTFNVDTVAPRNPWVTQELSTSSVTLGLAVGTSQDNYSFFSIGQSGGATLITTKQSLPQTVTSDGQTISSSFFLLDNPVPDGSYVVIRAVDPEGNESSTLYIPSLNSGTSIDLARTSLKNFELSLIDLSGASANLSITEEQISSLVGPDKALVIRGGADDHVALSGTYSPDLNRIINGQSYSAFILGESTILIDDDIRRSGIV